MVFGGLIILNLFAIPVLFLSTNNNIYNSNFWKIILFLNIVYFIFYGMGCGKRAIFFSNSINSHNIDNFSLF